MTFRAVDHEALVGTFVENFVGTFVGIFVEEKLGREGNAAWEGPTKFATTFSTKGGKALGKPSRAPSLIGATRNGRQAGSVRMSPRGLETDGRLERLIIQASGFTGGI